MVIGAFPAAKLGVLAIKQISKPIANILKANAKSSPVFRKFVCMPPAQFYNWVEVKTKMWALNLGRPVTVPPLNEAMAIELGANLLGEFIIFAIGAGLLIFEYTRQTIKENAKNEAARLEKLELINTISELGFRMERQDAQIREMTRALADMESRNIFKWTKERLQEYQPFDPSTPDQSLNTNTQKAYEGYYDPLSSITFGALNFLETETNFCRFTNDRKDKKAQKAIDNLETLSQQLMEPLTEAAQSLQIHENSINTSTDTQ